MDVSDAKRLKALEVENARLNPISRLISADAPDDGPKWGLRFVLTLPER